jgi:hypothetical protein
MKPINIFGITIRDGLPTLEACVIGHINDAHINLIELARAEFIRFQDIYGRRYAGMILTLGDDEVYVYNFT